MVPPALQHAQPGLHIPPVPAVVRPGALFVSPVAVARPLAVRTSERRNNGNITDGVTIPFVPPSIATVLRNQQGQRIIEVCIWLQSGVILEDISVFISDDMKSLKFQVPMDNLMQNGWGLHRDVVIGGNRMSREERLMHVRVHHWNAFIDEMRTSDGLLPTFISEVALPVEVCSKKILRKTGKESSWGSKMLVVDLLVEDSNKLPASAKHVFDLVDDDDDDVEEVPGWDSDDLTLNSKKNKRTEEN
jgi:hypothetical protein